MSIASYAHYLHGPAGETWQGALARFGDFCRSLRTLDFCGETYDLLLDELYASGEIFEWCEPNDPPAMAAAQHSFGEEIPSDLALLLRHPFAIFMVSAEFGRYGDRRYLEINRHSSLQPCLHPFCTAIAWNYGHYFAQAELSAAEIAHLNGRYFGFARFSDDDHQSTYLLCDKEGRYGSFEFASEDYPRTLANLAPFLHGEALTDSLDSVVVMQINRTMTSMLLREDIPVPGALDG